ncbi:MAG: alpha/beta fold hydrolase [Bacteroidota bacterium]
MPFIASQYQGPPFYLFHRHLETIVPSKFRKVEGVNYDRERLELEDGDFIDLDWIRNGHKRLAFLSHGLEGSSERPYMLGMAKIFRDHGWDVMAWNNRSCSGEMNRLPKMYHQGATGDMGAVMDHCLKGDYEEVVMVSFSLGGGMTLKYLGEKSQNLDPRIKKAMVISVPVDLPASVEVMHLPKTRLYRKYFLQKLEKKIRQKAEQFPQEVSLEGFEEIDSLSAFDERYTAPMFGFDGAAHYYATVNPRQYLVAIAIPTLIVNAQNDPILDPVCYSPELVDGLDNIWLEAPKRGGHVGFLLARNEFSYADLRAIEWAEAR